MRVNPRSMLRVAAVAASVVLIIASGIAVQVQRCTQWNQALDAEWERRVEAGADYQEARAEMMPSFEESRPMGCVEATGAAEAQGGSEITAAANQTRISLRDYEERDTAAESEAACARAQWWIDQDGAPPPGRSVRNLSTLLPTRGPRDFDERGYDGPLSLEQFASSKGNPPLYRDALGKLGFQRAYARYWGFNGAQASAEVVEFASPRAARVFHTFATWVACPGANEAFRVAGVEEGVGLEVRYGEMTIEQVSFVRGSRRYYVALWMFPNFQERSRTVAFARAVSDSSSP